MNVPSATSVLGAATVPLDVVRSAFLRSFGARLSPYVARRDVRVGLVGLLAVAFALTLATTLPLWAMAVGPLLLGVPHLVSDVRYLVVRRGDHRDVRRVLFVFAPLLVTLVRPAPSWGFAVAFTAVALARASLRRRAIALVLCALAYALVLRHERLVAQGFVHAHNLVAVALWWSWRARKSIFEKVVLGVFVAASVAIFVGAFDHAASFASPYSAEALDRVVRGVAPVADGTLGLRLVVFFAFAQSVHYGVWLRLVPEDDRGRSIRSFGSSVRALAADVGPWTIVSALAATVGFVAWGVVDVGAAGRGYVNVASFHGYLEVAVALGCLVEGRRPGTSAPTSR
ncbi:MAG: hypothetical protein U0169_27280 [Polyangiaceae bacterium]